MSGSPDVYTRSLRVYIRTYQANHNAHGKTVMYHIAPLVSWKQLKPGIMQVSKPIVFIGKIVGIDCGFSLIGTFSALHL